MSDPWHHQDIVAEVKKRGSSLTRLSLENGYRRSTLQRSLYKRYPRAHAVIAAFLGRSRHEIWPQWYGPDGEPLPIPRSSSGRAAA